MVTITVTPSVAQCLVRIAKGKDVAENADRLGRWLIEDQTYINGWEEGSIGVKDVPIHPALAVSF